jgi:hypothetical protein
MRTMGRFPLLCVFAICPVMLAPLAKATAAEKIDGTFSASDGVKIHFIQMGRQRSRDEDPLRPAAHLCGSATSANTRRLIVSREGEGFG